jgi:hypothetical protein
VIVPPGTPQHCERCGYCLRGLEEIKDATCPECGLRIPADQLSANSLTRSIRPGLLIKTLSVLQFCSTCAAFASFLASFHFNFKIPAEEIVRNRLFVTSILSTLASFVLGMTLLRLWSFTRKCGAVRVYIALSAILLPVDLLFLFAGRS